MLSISFLRVAGVTAGVFGVLILAACVQAVPAKDTGDALPLTPTSPSVTPGPGTTSSPTPAPAALDQPLSYDQDLKPIFASDCVLCHSTARPLGRYSMSTYRDVMTDVRPGSASSPLVTVTQSRGSMYRYFSGNRAAKSDLVRRWIVNWNAQQSR
jgi:hypothetical protein